MPAIKARCPHQYTDQDGVSPRADGLSYATRGSKISGYVGSSSTHRYRQVDIGYGSRSDFTTLNVEHKGEPKYEFEKFGSVGYQIHMQKERGTKKNETFGIEHSKYHKAVVSSGFNHYLGKGIRNHNGLGPAEFSQFANLTMTSAPRLPSLSTDRGLFNPTSKQVKQSMVGPGAYADETKSAFPSRTSHQI